MRTAAFVYDEQVSRHTLREDHVMRPTRLKYTFELLDAYGAFRDSRLVAPRPATREELLWFHTEEYVEAVRSSSLNLVDNAGNFTPIGPFGSLQVADEDGNTCLATDFHGFANGVLKPLPLVANVADVDPIVSSGNTGQFDDLVGVCKAPRRINEARRQAQRSVAHA
ncbi:MAG: hypothetical protein IIC80_12245 [Chloroflexi bacterium]|nr:hypothetical protein [Chloroflexota bacterium]